MAVKNILLYPDPRLKEACEAVTDFGESLRALVNDLWDTLRSGAGVGLAAPQIGMMKRVLVIDVSAKFPGSKKLVLVNPQIIALAEKKLIREGCLSIPDLTANVLRADRVRFRALDETGAPYEMESVGLEAIAVQHENDHLDGILFLDRVACLKTDVFRRKSRPKVAS